MGLGYCLYVACVGAGCMDLMSRDIQQNSPSRFKIPNQTPEGHGGSIRDRGKERAVRLGPGTPVGACGSGGLAEEDEDGWQAAGYRATSTDMSVVDTPGAG